MQRSKSESVSSSKCMGFDIPAAAIRMSTSQPPALAAASRPASTLANEPTSPETRTIASEDCDPPAPALAPAPAVDARSIPCAYTPTAPPAPCAAGASSARGTANSFARMISPDVSTSRPAALAASASAFRASRSFDSVRAKMVMARRQKGRCKSSLAVSSPIPSDPPVMNACRLDSMPGGSVRRAAGGRMGARSERESDVVTAAVAGFR